MSMSSMPVVDDRYDGYGLLDLQSAMDHGQLSSVELVAYYLARIDELDTRGPTLRAVLSLNAEAGVIAARLDGERGHGRVRGPLHGIPVMLKANINTDDDMPTTAGSLALSDFHPGLDAAFVKRLRDAGAIILGKTNLSEWANFRSTHSSSGWSSGGGQTRNPYALDRTPGGSSSGSAVAMREARAVLAGLGAHLVEIELPDDHAMEAAELELMLYEIKHGLHRYLSTYGSGSGPKTIGDYSGGCTLWFVAYSA